VLLHQSVLHSQAKSLFQVILEVWRFDGLACWELKSDFVFFEEAIFILVLITELLIGFHTILKVILDSRFYYTQISFSPGMPISRNILIDLKAFNFLLFLLNRIKIIEIIKFGHLFEHHLG